MTSPNLFIVDDLPHGWLFPQVTAVVQHGGWAAHMEELRVGNRRPGITRRTAQHLADAMRKTVENDALCTRAAALGQKISDEAGVRRAVGRIERYVAWGRM